MSTGARVRTELVGDSERMAERAKTPTVRGREGGPAGRAERGGS